MNLNPNNPVARQVGNQWHKIAALIMLKLEKTELAITAEDIMKLGPDVNIFVDARPRPGGESIIIKIVDEKTAIKLAREACGMADES